MQTPIRRVVTGHNDSGKSCVAFDGPLPTGAVPHDRYVWTTDGARAVDGADADAARAEHRLEPPGDGSVFRVIELPPQRVMADLTTEQLNAFFRDLFAGMGASHCRVDTTRSPGMHKTRTIDYAIVMRGEVTLLLDEGEVTLKAGDVLVQRGTNHDWIVRGEEPALVAVVMLPLETDR